MTRFFLGLDLGQSQDFTAIAVLERVELTGEWDGALHAPQRMTGMQLRYLERMALGTPYPEIVERVRSITRSPMLQGTCHLVVDATGVGRPVVDLLRGAGLGCGMSAAVITAGHEASYSADGGYHHVPKRDVIVGLQVVLQRGGLRIAAGLKYGPALVEEMAAMRVKHTPAGNEQLGVWREGEHDDLVFAVGLAYWGARRIVPRVSGDDGVWRWKGDAA
jgi:hypothetical protein